MPDGAVSSAAGVPDPRGFDKQTFKALARALLPRGRAWPDRPGSLVDGYAAAVGATWADFNDVVSRFLAYEATPSRPIELLPDWEEAVGLPDDCTPVPTTLAERQAALRARLADQGGQSIAFFLGLAQALGYADATIEEFRPFTCGFNTCGQPLGGPPEVRFVWRVRINAGRSTLFRAGVGRCGEPLGSFERADDLECVFRALKPAHTVLIFSYEGV